MTNKILPMICVTTLTATMQVNAQTQAIEPVMETIAGGSLVMQTSDGKQHPIQLAEFSLGKYEVTVAEFRRFVEATNYPVPTECRHQLNTWFLPFSKGNWETNALNTSEYQPVVCINWKSANAYAEWLAEETGKPYRLPTEAEWEFAARAGTQSDYYFGEDSNNTKVCDYENTGDLYGENWLQMNHNTSYHNWSGELARCSDNSAYASIVGMYKPNPNGLHDMMSNVLEFLGDCYSSDITDLPKDGSAYITENCERRATRGSSWHWSHWPITNRGSIPAEFAGGVDGFRLAIDGSKPPQSPNTRDFLQDLMFAQEQEHKRRELHAPIPAAVEGLKLEERAGHVKLSWQASQSKKGVSYRVYRNDIPGKMFRLYAADIYGTEFIDASPLHSQSEYTVVAVKQHQQSFYAPSVSKSTWPADVPGIIEAEWLIEDTSNAIGYTSDESSGPRLGYNLSGIGGIAKDLEMDYRINVTDSGRYQLKYRIAAPEDTKGFNVLLNGELISFSPVAATGGYHEWQTQQGETFELPKGEHVLTFVSLDKHWKLNWFELTAQ